MADKNTQVESPEKTSLTPRQHLVEAANKLKALNNEKFVDAIAHIDTALYKLNKIANEANVG